MLRRSLKILALLFTASISVAQNASYYKAIQKNSSQPLKPGEFKKIEDDALKNFASPASYETLTNTFANTTERVWTVVYGETFCNLSGDAERSRQIGSTVFDQYDKALTKKGNDLSINLTENAEAERNGFPFESQFEMSVLISTLPISNDLKPMTIQKLSDIRKNQLSLWAQKKLPSNELMARLATVQAAGHFEAYNYWLFQAARPDEFKAWKAAHGTAYQSWLNWQKEYPFTPKTPDFHRLFMVRGH